MFEEIDSDSVLNTESLTLNFLANPSKRRIVQLNSYRDHRNFDCVNQLLPFKMNSLMATIKLMVHHVSTIYAWDKMN